MIDLQKLKQAAEAATPGPWTDDQPSDSLHAVRAPSRSIVADVGFSGSVQRDVENAAYIALANPAAILKLIKRLELAEMEARHAYRSTCTCKIDRLNALRQSELG